MSSIALDIRDAADHPGNPPAEPASAPGDEGTGRPAAPASRPAPARVRCAHCGTVLATDPDRPAAAREETDAPAQLADTVAEPDPGFDSAAAAGHADPNDHVDYADDPPHTAIPVHALDPAPAAPFTVRLCPGSGRGADPRTGDVPDTKPDAAPAPATTLPTGLHWRTQPFSHRDY